MRLVDKYRPRTLADVWGQDWITGQLKLWAQAPTSAAFVFSGGTGTGKTSAAIALAADLGVAIDADEMGGLWQIASGSQTGETVRRAIDNLRVSPWQGSGWKMLLVNEADCMTPNASYAWLDILEGNNLPVKTVVVFTTNEARKLARRLIDRCEHYHFESGALILRPELQRFACHIWKLETGRDDCPDIDAFGQVGDENAEASFRRLLQQMEPAVRTVKAGIEFAPRITMATPEPMTVVADRGAAARKAWETRRRNMAKKSKPKLEQVHG